VHAFPSLHAVPSAFAGFEQSPVCVSQVPATWHWSEAVQTTAVPPQTPAVHTSLVVHASPSLQADPFAFAGFEHTPVCESHVPALWHWSEAVHTTAVPVQTPAEQASDVVHALPSLHDAVLFVCRHALPTQESLVHGLLSSHSAAVLQHPATTPCWHVPVPSEGLSDGLHVGPFVSVPFSAAEIEFAAMMPEFSFNPQRPTRPVPDVTSWFMVA
jgi:hypothetical protein